MVFYTGKIVLELNNPTVVVLTDRNDLDQQLFDTFAACKQLLRQTPVQAEDRGDLKKLLKTEGGGIVIFTTIQKFAPEEGSSVYETLSERRNIIVMADEAHRSQYGFAAKTIEKENQAVINHSFAKYLRDGLLMPASSASPEHRLKETTLRPLCAAITSMSMTLAEAVEDGATVRIYCSPTVPSSIWTRRYLNSTR